MKRFHCCLAVLALAGASASVLADPDRDERGHGPRGHHGGEYKESYWEGDCLVERRWKKNGKYAETRRCEAPRRYSGYPPPVYPATGVVVQPPAVVIQPPPIVIK